MNAAMSGCRHRSKPNFGWIDDVKQSLGKRDISVDTARDRAMNRLHWIIDVNELVLTRP